MFFDRGVRQDFTVDVKDRRKRRDSTKDKPIWIVTGTLTAAIKDHWVGDGEITIYSWDFYVVYEVVDREKRVLQFKPEDYSGGYSTFFRALIWNRLIELL
jgi:hypothetical protein